MRLSVPFIFAVFCASTAYSDVIRVGTETGFEPYIGRDKQGELFGFDKDLMDSVCHEISSECVWTDMAFVDLIPALVDNEVDIVIGGFSVTPERLRSIDFSVPYLYSNSGMVFVGRDLNTRPDQARIAVQEGTTHEAYLAENGFTFESFSTSLAAFDSAKNGNTDLAFGAEGNFEPLIFSSGHAMKIVRHAPAAGSETAIGLRKSDTNLKTLVDNALSKFLSDGTIGTLSASWFAAGERT